MSAPGRCWRRLGCPAPPPDATPTAGPGLASRRPAASSAHPDTPPAGAARSVRRALLAALVLTVAPLLTAFSFEAAAQSPPAANADGSRTVPHDRTLTPSTLRGGGKRRLLLLADAWHAATSTGIATRDTHVRTQAAIRPCANLFAAHGPGSITTG